MKRFTKAALAVALTALSSYTLAANTPGTTSVTPAQREQIEEVVHQYLLQKPEVVLEALQILQKRQYDEAEKTVKQTQQKAASFAAPLFQQANDPVAGNPKGTITVTEFFDYQCPHCVDMAPVIESIIKANPNVRIVFKEFPIRGPMSEQASRAALAANKQGKYYAFSHALLTANQPLTPDAIFAAAKNAGLNVDQLKKDMNDKSVEDQLKSNMKLGQDLKLFGTPAFFIGKSDGKGVIAYIPGQMNQAQLQNEIDKASK